MLDSPDIDAICFVGSAKTGAVHLRARGRHRQARAGARRREEPHGRDARRGDGQDRRQHHRLGVRRGRPALHGRLGRDHRRRREEAAVRRPAPEGAEALTVGDGMEKGIHVGPVVSSAARDRILGMIEKGIEAGRDARGRRPLAGAQPRRRLRRPDDPRRRQPDMEVAQEEIFGPVLTVITPTRSSRRSRSSTARATATARRSSPSPAPPSAATGPTSRSGMIGVNVGVAAPVGFFPFSRLEGLVLRRHARAGGRRGRLLHAQEDGHDALVLGRAELQVLQPSRGTRTDGDDREALQLRAAAAREGPRLPLLDGPGRRSRRSPSSGPRASTCGTTTATATSTSPRSSSTSTSATSTRSSSPPSRSRPTRLCTIAPFHANDAAQRGGPADRRARARRPRHGVLHQRRRRGDRERHAHGPAATPAATRCSPPTARYHGATGGSITLTGDPRRWPSEPGIPGVVHFCGPVPVPLAVPRHDRGRGVRAGAAAPRRQIMVEGPHTVAGDHPGDGRRHERHPGAARRLPRRASASCATATAS